MTNTVKFAMKEMRKQNKKNVRKIKKNSRNIKKKAKKNQNVQFVMNGHFVIAFYVMLIYYLIQLIKN